MSTQSWWLYQHWWECKGGSHYNFTSSTHHVLFILFGRFGKWKASSHTAAVLWAVTSRISSKQHTASLCSSHPAITLIPSLRSSWCFHTIVLTWLQLERIPILFIRVLISIWSVVHAFPIHMLKSLSVDEILLPRYVNVKK